MLVNSLKEWNLLLALLSLQWLLWKQHFRSDTSGIPTSQVGASARLLLLIAWD